MAGQKHSIMFMPDQLNFYIWKKEEKKSYSGAVRERQKGAIDTIRPHTICLTGLPLPVST